MDNNTTNPLLKRCTKCGEEFPATAEYFYTRTDSSLRTMCKTCFKQQIKAVQQRNPEKRREYNRRSYQRNYKPYHERDQKYKENARARVKRWAAAHPEKVRERGRQQWQQMTPEMKARQQAAAKRYRAAKPEKARLHAHVYRARKRALPATFTATQWQACLEYFNHTCAYCGAQQSFWHVLEQDHFIPLSSHGSYTADNIVPACKSCNASKNDSEPTRWLKGVFGKRKSEEVLKRIEEYFFSLDTA